MGRGQTTPSVLSFKALPEAVSYAERLHTLVTSGLNLPHLTHYDSSTIERYVLLVPLPHLGYDFHTVSSATTPTALLAQEVATVSHPLQFASCRLFDLGPPSSNLELPALEYATKLSTYLPSSKTKSDMSAAQLRSRALAVGASLARKHKVPFVETTLTALPHQITQTWILSLLHEGGQYRHLAHLHPPHLRLTAFDPADTSALGCAAGILRRCLNSEGAALSGLYDVSRTRPVRLPVRISSSVEIEGVSYTHSQTF